MKFLFEIILDHSLDTCQPFGLQFRSESYDELDQDTTFCIILFFLQPVWKNVMGAEII